MEKENKKKLVETSNKQNEIVKTNDKENKENKENKNLNNGDYQSPLKPNIERKCMDIITNKNTFCNVCDLILVKKLLTSIDAASENQIVLEVINAIGSKKYIIPFNAISTREGVYNALSKQGFALSNCNFATYLSSYVAVEVRKIQELQQDEYVVNGIGWVKTPDNQLAFVLDDTYGTDKKIKSLKELSFKKGDKEAYYKFVNDIICPSYPLQLAFTLGLTSIVTSLFKEQTGINVIMIDLAGSSSTGKSTAQMLAISTFGNPQISNTGLFRTFNGTYNSFIAGNNGFHGVPIIMDDATVQDSANWEKLVYEMVAGENKTRCDTTGQLQTKMDNWDGCVIISSEYALFDNTNTKLGAQARLLVAENIIWTQNADESVKIKQFVMNNYGHVAPDFVEKLLEYIKLNGLSSLQDMYKKEYEKINNKIQIKDNLTERICSQISLIALTAELINKFLDLNFDCNEIISPFVEKEIKNVSTRNIYDNALNAIKEFITQNDNRFLYKGQTMPNNCIGCIRVGENTKEVSILQGVLNNYLKSINITNTKIIFEQWLKSGVLVGDAGRITKKEHYLNSARVYYFVFDIKKETKINYLSKIYNLPSEKFSENNIDYLITEQEKTLNQESTNNCISEEKQCTDKEYTDDDLKDMFGSDENE